MFQLQFQFKTIAIASMNQTQSEKQKPTARHRYIYIRWIFNYNNGFYYFEFFVISIVLFYIAFHPILRFFDDFICRASPSQLEPYKSDWARRQTFNVYTCVRFFAHFVNMQLKQKPKRTTMKNAIHIANVLIRIMSKRVS